MYHAHFKFVSCIYQATVQLALYFDQGIVVDAKCAAILESLPPKVPRSRLEPYRELIREMRRRGRTYREIAHVLGDRCQVQVTASAVHNFVSRRSRPKPPAAVLPHLPEEAAESLASPMEADGVLPTRPDPDVKQRIEGLKRRAVPAGRPTKPVFAYDENEPLRVRSTTLKKSE